MRCHLERSPPRRTDLSMGALRDLCHALETPASLLLHAAGLGLRAMGLVGVASRLRM